MNYRLNLTSFFASIFFIFIQTELSLADITVVREVIITPKSVNAAANIGSVNSSPNVRMESAKVDIFVGAPDDSYQAEDYLKPIPLEVKALFTLINQSDKKLKLTVGFPVSNSEYSSYELSSFQVQTDGFPREVFHRISGYPRRILQQNISIAPGTEGSQPPLEIDRKSMHISGRQLMGKDAFQNLMVWEESFNPGQQKKVEVNYKIFIPLQEKKVIREKVKGNHKGIWPQEANNIPVGFIKKLQPGKYYFFDYYLTSGASWAGPIAFEDITLKFDRWWKDPDFYSTLRRGHFSWSNTTLSPGLPVVAYYQLRDIEPTENIYIAIRPGKNNEIRPKLKSDSAGSTQK